MNRRAEGAEADAALLRLAAGGFRDMTRVAAGHPGIWPDICADNAAAIVAAPRPARRGPDRHAPTGSPGATAAGCSRCSSGRARPAARCRPGRTRPDRLAELRVPVPDREGVLAEITTLAGDLGINIYDIEIAHSAEGPRGVLVLVVDARRADQAPRTPSWRAGYWCTVQDAVVSTSVRPTSSW